MHWIDEYDLFLFDFDGLLVDTEKLHYLAYVTMCHKRGFEIPWDFPRYYQIAQKSPDNIKNHLYLLFPDMQRLSWDTLYQEKKALFLKLLTTNEVALMPGVEELLRRIQHKKLCVVTHSGKELIQCILKKNHLLTNSIHLWITREDYKEPKPSPEGYLLAIKLLGSKSDKVIGFEDSTRGMQALLQAPLKPVVVNPFSEEMVETCKKHNCTFFHNFHELLKAPTL